MSNTKQTDYEIYEDQLLNFLVNALDEKASRLHRLYASKWTVRRTWGGASRLRR